MPKNSHSFPLGRNLYSNSTTPSINSIASVSATFTELGPSQTAL
ncbi:MAG: hypothetical protein ACM37W_19655 [Actinomycetota bacterium]